nr:hypothetical protein [Tanacetum cinerariifolium]
MTSTPFGEFLSRGENVSSSMGLQLTGNLLSMYTLKGGSSLSPNSRLWNGTTISIYIGFRDGTLNDVRNALDDRLKGIQMQYLPTTICRRGDKARVAAMIQAIDKMLKTRRIMRS